MRQASGWLVQLLPEGFGGPKKIIPYGMRLVLPSRQFYVLGSVQPPLSWRKGNLFSHPFYPSSLGSPSRSNLQLVTALSMGMMDMRS